MENNIFKLAVVGAGTMGASIAANGARAGLDVILMVRGKGDESGRARADKAIKTIVSKGEMKGSAEKRILAGVTPADMDEDASLLADCDLVIEAVAENLDIKQKTISQIFRNAGEHTVVGTNTSNISIASIEEGFCEDWQKRFLGIHFFNPVRYMELVELIPGELTDKDVVVRLSDFIKSRIGKSPIVCKDAPGFIANRIGSMALMSVMNATYQFGYTVAKSDALTGDLIFRPRQGTFRLLDQVGLDICEHTSDYLVSAPIPEWEKPYRVKPAILCGLLERGFLGDKTGCGFYKKEKTVAGKQILMWDYKENTYIPSKKETVESLTGVKGGVERLRKMLFGKLPESAYVRKVVLEPLWLAMAVRDEISFCLEDIDTAMRGGYNWVKGPFELCDLIGAEDVLNAMREDGLEPPAWAVEKIGKDGRFYSGCGAPASMSVSGKNVLLENDAAVLRDIGDGIACFSLKTKANTYTGPAAELLLEAAKEVQSSRLLKGLVINNPGPDFGAGANLNEVLGCIKEDRFDELENSVAKFQKANLAIKYMKKPAVCAVKGRALGGSAEMLLHAGRVVSAKELYAGLVEMGVGLVPSGGGCAELLFRGTTGLEYGQTAYILDALDKLIFPIAQAKFSSSAENALKNGYLKDCDVIISNTADLADRAKATAVYLADNGWLAPVHGTAIAAGEAGYSHIMASAHVMLEGRMMTKYDGVIVEKLARIFTGGDALMGEKLTEEDIMELERKAFMELCHNEKTVERIQGMISTGKPVRN